MRCCGDGDRPSGNVNTERQGTVQLGERRGGLRQHEVVAHAEIEKDALPLALLGDERQTGPDGCLRDAGRHDLTFYRDGAAIGTRQPENDLQ